MKPIKTRKFEKFLKSKGLVYKRTEGSHDLWDLPDNSLKRPVTFRGAKDEIPPLHIQTNLDTLGISVKEFNELRKKL